MHYNIVYFANARINVANAKKWYNRQRKGLGNIFASAIKNAIIRVQSHPESYAVRYKNIRIAHPKNFPYNIHFYIDEVNRTITITNIIHSARNASY